MDIRDKFKAAVRKLAEEMQMAPDEATLACHDLMDEFDEKDFDAGPRCDGER